MDSEIYEKNLLALQSVSPREFEKIQLFKDDDVLPVTLSCSPEFSTWQFLAQSGKFLHDSTFGFNTLNSQKKLYILYGVGDGEFLNRLRLQPDVCELLVYEPSIILFKDLLKQIDLSDIIRDDKVRFILGAMPAEYRDEIGYYFTTRIERFHYAANHGNLIVPGVEKIPGYEKVFLNFSKIFNEKISEIFAFTNASTSEDSFHGLINTLRNYQSYKTIPHVSDLANQFSDWVGVVVATGPSLKHSLEFLRKIQKQAVIFSCDSALKILLEEGIVPHFVGCLERDGVTQNSLNVEQTLTTCLVAPLVICPLTYSSFNGPKLAVNQHVGFSNWLFPESPRYSLGQSVSQLCLTGLSILGCQEIYLVGVDCAYDPQTGVSHHNKADPNVLTSNQWFKENEREGIVDFFGYDGKSKQTYSNWYVDALVIAGIVKDRKINAKRVCPIEYGFPIENTTRVDPEALLEIKSKNTESISERFLSLYRSAKPMKTDTSLLNDDYHFLNEVQNTASNCLLKISSYLYDHQPYVRENVSKFESFFSSLNEIRFSIMNNSRGAYAKILHPMLQNTYALNGFKMTKLVVEEKNEVQVILKKITLYQEWFTQMLLWSSRVSHLLRSEGFIQDASKA